MSPGQIMMLHRIILMWLLHASAQVACAQVVNIESERLKTDTNGLYGSVSADFALTSNTKTVVVFDGMAQLEYKYDKDLYLLLGNYGLVNGDKESFSNNAFIHFRYNRKMTRHLRWEIFTQLQFNKISKINLRYLAGTGPRFKLVEAEKIALYAATLVMFEYEEDDTTENSIHRDVRSSSYVSFTLPLTENLEIISTTYYQPLYTDFSDFRIMNQVSAALLISEKLQLEPKFNFLYDSRPVAGVPEVNYSLMIGLKYQFR